MLTLLLVFNSHITNDIFHVIYISSMIDYVIYFSLISCNTKNIYDAVHCIDTEVN